MNKFLSLIALVAVTSSFAGDIIPSDNVKDAKKQVEQKCKSGCLVLSPEDIAKIDASINAAVERARAAALEQGKNICNSST